MILIISTFQKKAELALFSENQELEKISWITNNNLIVDITNQFDQLISNKKVAHIKQIILINGPGSYAGLRIGTILAKRIAHFNKIDIKVISSLEAIYVSTRETSYVKKGRNVYFQYDGYEIKEIETENNYDKIIDLDFIEIINYLKDKPAHHFLEIKPDYMKAAF